ncbi:BnaCnng63740D [Brassica napus]|uniref:BnaCnng63740D protein n=1 Tax=Brassica napus TaxID=3708 RepID=A0A078JPH4_BRANA|nr:BnaCnng63740D [Brassica napus]
MFCTSLIDKVISKTRKPS